MINRIIQNSIEKALFTGKVVILYGARQVGKTTLVREIQKKYESNSIYLNCDEPDIRYALESKTSTEIKSFFGNNKLVILDEAQRIMNIGLTLKLVADNFPDIQVIATGSSSFELSNKIAESLTGRKYEFFLYPFSLEELKPIYSELEMDRLLEEKMIFGMYPEIILGGDEKQKKLKSLARSYAYKDILQFQNIKNPDVLEKLLQALALQIGNEVSYNELAAMVGVTKNTVENYVRILEQAFIIFRLTPFSRNLRNELKKLRKIFFYDTGIRNALINNFNPLNLRSDVGALWENFLIAERMKLLNNHEIEAKGYFWRTQQGQELDYLEDSGEKIQAVELKYKKDKFKTPKSFSDAYPDAEVKLINKSNYKDFVFNTSLLQK